MSPDGRGGAGAGDDGLQPGFGAGDTPHPGLGAMMRQGGLGGVDSPNSPRVRTQEPAPRLGYGERNLLGQENP